jgi:integrase
MTRSLTGVREDRYGYQAFLKVKGRFISKRFPKDTPLATMREWRVTARARAILNQPEERGPSFREDAKDYLKAVQGMPTYRFRADDIARWVTLFGDRPRSSITALEIRTHLERWRVTYAPSTVNHRRTALSHLWTVLDGKAAPNPVRGVPRYRETPRAPRILTPKLVRKILAQMPKTVTRARLAVMAWTGLPPKQIMRLEPKHIDWNRAIFIVRRQKGRGLDGRWLPLMPEGWKALREFKRVGAWGEFSTASLRRSFRLAAQKVEKTLDVTPYDLRHAFLTWVAMATKDDRVVAALGLHADERMSRRYTVASVDHRVSLGLDAVASAVASRAK